MARVLRHLFPACHSRVWREFRQPSLSFGSRICASYPYQAASHSQTAESPATSSRRSGEISIVHGDSRTVDNEKTNGYSGSTYTYEDTIAAIVTSLGGQDGSVAIVRLSGSSAVSIAGQLFRPARKSRNGASWQPKSHKVEYGTVVDSSGAIIDEVLVVPMLAPRSYTREDVVELQCHGGSICVHRVLQLCLQSGARLAKPGEFSMRAFLNGRLDLAQAENVAELISAKSSVAAETALAGMQGGLSSLVHTIREQCLELLGDIEARLDFEDEMPVLEQAEVVSKIDSMWERLQEALGTARRGELLQAGLQVAIVGRPNVGKSSLLNAWSQSSRAIVTDVPGTTRDVVEADVVVGGISVNLLDTAGIRATDDLVESIGVQRSKAAAKGADIIVMVVSALDGWTPQDNDIFEEIWECPTSLQGGTASYSNGSLSSSKIAQVPSILVINKVDTASPTSVILPEKVSNAFSTIVPTCAPQSVGLKNLEAALLKLVGFGEVTTGGRQWAANQRQAEQLLRASEALERVKASAQQDFPIDMWTVDLKEAAIALGQISGDDVTEELLSSIFSRFCIGK
ncbi:tRNA modification GTPase [Marchantia polymorpha subsp. ruderalis]|uniref:TrmE-type G domain-containing protein n=3 Tax=Marchantia polymorpha TaxID=3197 RepID=A0A176VX28_MARPO|nr:hypothetical protein AXG93_4620s1750 [Marchantia polymorpha subsp. ruderalis]